MGMNIHRRQTVHQPHTFYRVWFACVPKLDITTHAEIIEEFTDEPKINVFMLSCYKQGNINFIIHNVDRVFVSSHLALMSLLSFCRSKLTLTT